MCVCVCVYKLDMKKNACFVESIDNFSSRHKLKI